MNRHEGIFVVLCTESESDSEVFLVMFGDGNSLIDVSITKLEKLVAACSRV